VSGEDRFAIGGSHGQGHFAFEEDVEATRIIPLTEKNAVFWAKNCCGLPAQRQDEIRIGQECRWVKIHDETPIKDEWFSEAGPLAAP
jgi:hypothetical protein